MIQFTKEKLDELEALAADLVTALEELCLRCDGEEGVRAEKITGRSWTQEECADGPSDTQPRTEVKPCPNDTTEEPSKNSGSNASTGSLTTPGEATPAPPISGLTDTPRTSSCYGDYGEGPYDQGKVFDKLSELCPQLERELAQAIADRTNAEVRDEA